MSGPYPNKLRDLDDLRGVERGGLSDDQRAVWAAKREQLRQAASDCGVRWPDVLNLLTQLVIAARPTTGCCDPSVGQLEAKTGLGEKQVRRGLEALKQAGLLTDVRRGGGPGRNGRPAQATVRQLLFLTPVESEPTADELRTVDAGTPDSTGPNSGQSGVRYYRASTEPPTDASASCEVTAAAGSGQGGGNEAKSAKSKGGDWVGLVAANAARESVRLKPTGIHSAAAVLPVRTKAALGYLEALKVRSDWEALQLLPPDHPALVRWLGCQVADQSAEAGNYDGAEAINAAQQLWAERDRKAS